MICDKMYFFAGYNTFVLDIIPLFCYPILTSRS